MVMRLSIIIPIYNAEKYLERCIKTLYMQELLIDEFEVIMINDGSTDGSFMIAQNLARQYNNIILLTQENLGVSAARNRGLDEANGDRVIFVDSDDYLIPYTLHKILKYAEDFKVDICTFNILVASDKQDYISYQPISKKPVITGEEALISGFNPYSVCSKIFSLNFINSNHLRFKRIIVSEDVEFNMRAYILATRVTFTGYVSYYYYNNTKSITSNSDLDKLRKKCESSIIVNKSFLNMSLCVLSKSLRKNLFRRSNSMAAGNIIMIIKNRKNNSKTVSYELLKMMKDSGLYPIKGRTLSFKTTIILPFLNCEFLVRKLIKK